MRRFIVLVAIALMSLIVAAGPAMASVVNIH